MNSLIDLQQIIPKLEQFETKDITLSVIFYGGQIVVALFTARLPEVSP